MAVDAFIRHTGAKFIEDGTRACYDLVSGELHVQKLGTMTLDGGRNQRDWRASGVETYPLLIRDVMSGPDIVT
jgi:hypothetical protein